jgi:hypothetical protein
MKRNTVARAVTQLKEFDGKKLVHVSKEGLSSRRRERRRSSARSYSEELINVCLSAMKNLLSEVIYPYAESPSTDPRKIPHLLQHILNKHTTKPSQTFDVAPPRSLV